MKRLFILIIVLFMSGCTRNTKKFERLSLYSGDEIMKCIFGVSSEVSEFDPNDIQLKISLANNKEYNPLFNYYAAITISFINGNDLSIDDVKDKQKCSIIKEYNDFFNDYKKYEFKHNKNSFKYSEIIDLEQTFFPNDKSLVYITFIYNVSEMVDGKTCIYEDGRISYEINYDYVEGKLCIR